MSIAEVKVLYPSNYRDVVATLRYIADEVEKGSYGEVSLGGLVLMADQCQVFGMGRDDMGGNVATLLSAGAFNLVRMVADQGRE